MNILSTNENIQTLSHQPSIDAQVYLGEKSVDPPKPSPDSLLSRHVTKVDRLPPGCSSPQEGRRSASPEVRRKRDAQGPQEGRRCDGDASPATVSRKGAARDPSWSPEAVRGQSSAFASSKRREGRKVGGGEGGTKSGEKEKMGEDTVISLLDEDENDDDDGGKRKRYSRISR